MALIIEGGISIGGNITIAAEFIDPTANLVLFYDAGNSMCYNGSGSTFNTSYTGPNLNDYYQYGVVDLAGVIGNVWHSGSLSNGNIVGWTSQGVSSYFSFDAGNVNYISSDWQQATTLTSPTYTILAVVRPQDFNFGAIVGGDENIFYFTPTGGVNDGPSLRASNSYSGGSPVSDTTTAFETGSWYCVAVTYDADTGIMKLYTNGQLVNTSIPNVPSITHPTGLYWGTLEGELWYTGDISVCMVYERVLGAGEISQLSEVYLSRYAPPATSSAVFDQPYNGGPPVLWTVPEGVTSISVVAVGAGGSGTADSYSAPGGDTVMVRTDNDVYVPTTYTGTSNTIVVDNVASPEINNVTADGTWIVGGLDIGIVGSGIPAWALVTAVDVVSSPGNSIIGIDQTITTTAGDTFFFYQAIAAAEGGYEINESSYNTYNPNTDTAGGPGPRAQPLVTDGPYGAGGVVDWTNSWPIGGGGAGGYGTAGLALNVTQAGEWIPIPDEGGGGYHTMSFSNNNLTVTALPGMGFGQANQECMVLGTQFIPTASKAMYSVTVSQTAGIGFCGVGLSNYYESLLQYPGYSNDSVGYYDDGRIYINGSAVDTYTAFNEGGIVDVAVDTDLGLAWFRVAGGAWNSSGDPAAGTGGLDITALIGQNHPITLALGPWYDSASSIADIISVNTTATYSVPAGFTFVPGVAGAGGTGGGGSGDYAVTATPGTGGSAGGGGARIYDSGAGGGGTSLYGRGTSGAAGTSVDPAGVAQGGGGGSPQFLTDGNGGQATRWNGGRGGWPGGGGASATGYWDGGNGGALAYRNNYQVIPGEQYVVLVGPGGQGQSNGGNGANGGIRIVWPGDTRTFPNSGVGPDEVSVPTLEITSGNFSGSSPTGQLYFNITSDGGGTILETGVVWGLPGQDTYTNSIDVCDGISSTAQRKAIRADDSCGNPYTTGLTGAQSIMFNPDPPFYYELIDVRAYARNSAGVAYSPTTLTWTPTICLAEGTLIALADGNTKTIETITMNDLLKVWDFDNGVFTSTAPLWIKRKETTDQYNLIRFSDGSELKTIGQHRIFNKQSGAFTYPMTDATPVGTVTVNSAGQEVTVVEKRVVFERVNYYNVVTAGGYMNLYANTVLTSMRYNNIYPVADMQYVKDGRTLRDRSEFTGIADRWIDGLRLPEQTIDIKQIRKYVDRLERNEQQPPTSGRTPSWQ